MIDNIKRHAVFDGSGNQFSSEDGVAHNGGGKKSNSGWPLSHASSKVNRIYYLALAVILVFMGLGLAFILYCSEVSKEDTVGYIQGATQQITFALEQHVKDEFQTLMASATAAEDENPLAESATIRNLIKGMGEYNSYVAIGLADSSGQALWRDIYGRQHHSDMSGEDFIQQALTGKNTLTSPRLDTVSGLEVNYYAVPIYLTGSDKIKGALFVADQEDKLRNIVEHSLYAGLGLAHIINRNGDYVIESKSSLATMVTLGGGIFNLRIPWDTAMEKRIRDDLANGRSGRVEKDFYGQNRLIAYAPLKINDWYVFYAVPENMVSAGLKSLTIGAVVIISVAVALFILFIVLIRQANNQSRQSLETLAFVDPLTQKRNYQKFLLEGTELLRVNKGTRYALCYSDIKGFRYINGLFGRAVGDHLLCYWADFLDEITYPGEVFGRMGADVFVSLRKYRTRQEIEARVAGASSRLAVFPETLARGYKVEAYSGIYVIDDSDEGLSLSAMLDRAISAHKMAKAQDNGDRLRFYSHEMGVQKLWEAEVEAKMEAALEHNEFNIYLQPKIDIQHDDRIMGAEALVRWVSPEKGVIAPKDFIKLFEHNGFIVKLDRFVFEAACRYYNDSVIKCGLPPYVLSVNVSRLSLMQPDFVRIYQNIKERYSIPDKCLELEFTESLVFENHALFRSIVRECQHSGFLCSLDDFGAGYSALNLLRSIHVDVLKLDGLFFQVDDEEERGCKLVENIVSMAKSLGMKTVAEGVHAESMVKQLRAMGCEAVQGNVFAEPMPAEEFQAFVEVWNGYRTAINYII